MKHVQHELRKFCVLSLGPILAYFYHFGLILGDFGHFGLIFAYFGASPEGFGQFMA